MSDHRFLFRLPFALPALRMWSLAWLSLLLAAPLASAQSLWPSSAQWAQLQRRMTTEPDIRQTMASQRRIADDALSSAPQPMTSVSSGGRLQGDAVKAQTAASMKDMDKIQALAVTYKLSGDARYAARAGANQPTGQPIDETSLEPGIFAYRLIRPELPATSRDRIDGWMRNVARAEMASRVMKRPTATNNWHSHRLKIVGLIGYAVGDAQLIDYARQGFRAQIADNLRPDGESVD